MDAEFEARAEAIRLRAIKLEALLQQAVDALAARNPYAQTDAEWPAADKWYCEHRDVKDAALAAAAEAGITPKDTQ